MFRHDSMLAIHAMLEVGDQRIHLIQIIFKLNARLRRRVGGLGGDQQILIAVVALQFDHIKVVRRKSRASEPGEKYEQCS